MKCGFKTFGCVMALLAVGCASAADGGNASSTAPSPMEERPDDSPLHELGELQLRAAVDFCDVENVVAVVNIHRGKMHRCFDVEAENAAEIDGELFMTWRVNLEGRSTRVGVTESDFDNADLERCMRSVFEDMQFMRPIGGMCDFRLGIGFDGEVVTEWDQL